MAIQITRTDVWAAEIEDRPGALAERLSALSAAGADLGFVLAKGMAKSDDPGVVFITPLKGAKQLRAAEQESFVKTDGLHCLRVEGADKPGLGAGITEVLAREDINLRGLSATVVGRRFICYLALYTAADATRATRILKKL